MMELSVEQIKRIVEASLLMNREPQSAKKIAELFAPEENVTERAIVDTLTLLADDYRDRGVELVEVATGYRFQVCADLSPWISRTMAEKPQRYSRALLETLALIAYRQPITRAEIEEIRGVVVSTQIMRTLEEREWVRVIGHRDVPGRPALYATTKQFLNDLNLKSLGELPTLAELQDLDKVDGVFQQLNLDISNPEAATTENAAAENASDESRLLEAQDTPINDAQEVQLIEGADECSAEENVLIEMTDESSTEENLLTETTDESIAEENHLTETAEDLNAEENNHEIIEESNFEEYEEDDEDECCELDSVEEYDEEESTAVTA